MGVSKGGELSLLLGSYFPEIKAVAAYVPSSVVFQCVSTQLPSHLLVDFQGGRAALRAICTRGQVPELKEAGGPI